MYIYICVVHNQKPHRRQSEVNEKGERFFKLLSDKHTQEALEVTPPTDLHE